MVELRSTFDALFLRVGLIISNQYAKYVQKIDGYKGRVIYADFYFKGRYHLRLIQIYIHTHDNDKKDKLDIYRYIKTLLDSAKLNDSKVIIIGDFNADPDKLSRIMNSNRQPHWKYDLIRYLNRLNYKDVVEICHDTSTLPYTWS